MHLLVSYGPDKVTYARSKLEMFQNNDDLT